MNDPQGVVQLLLDRGTDSNALWVKVSIGPIHHTELYNYIFMSTSLNTQ
jgi:hypothetical protein